MTLTLRNHLLRLIIAVPCSLLTVPYVFGQSLLNDAEQREAVVAHDRWRAAVGVGGVRWAADLAGLAQVWADHLAKDNGCKMRHSSSNLRGNTGENLYWASPVHWSDGRSELQSVTPSKVIDAWGGELADYNPNSHQCSPGKVCGHYTQMVWRDSREIGCAMARCEDFSQVWVCRYRPAGNIVGRTPY